MILNHLATVPGYMFIYYYGVPLSHFDKYAILYHTCNALLC